ncbi:uncharacterized protein LOC120306250 [Crotalus tigris]|uniref:uncharacterized protein LOC120306250 n=1 Tax=Crotalus tigris TaxID=88082 RepID=UPI00192F7F34|nr:uncharacterized protein LOC120306250 [Crotalus tigris]
MVYLSPDHQVSIRILVRHVQHDRVVPLITLSQLLGKMISCISIVPWARLHSRALQWFHLLFQRRKLTSSNRKVRVSPLILKCLHWWTSQTIAGGAHFKEPAQLTLTTDASLFGWGTHLQSQLAQGRWSRRDLKHNINWLELRAIHLALRHFRYRVKGQHVLVLMDNIAAKAHVNRQGGTRSQSLMTEARLLCSWADTNLSSIKAAHILGETNRQADALNRATIDHSEWRLLPALFAEIAERFGRPALDLFASPENSQLLRSSHFPSPGVEGVDPLSSPWPGGLLHAFPPLPLMLVVIRKILQERAKVIFIAPHWPGHPWFPDLMSLSILSPWRIPPDRIVLSQGAL